MSEVLARHVVCVLGSWDDLDRVEAIVGRVGAGQFSLDREYSAVMPDERMSAAFEASADRVVPSMTPADRDAIARHRAVAYILSPSMAADRAQELSREMLAVTAALLDSGGVAAKSESAGIAHGRERWLALAARASEPDPVIRAGALQAAWVRRPIHESGVLYSCGMHLLGEPDIEISARVPDREAVGWIDALAIYLLAEKPARGVHDGEGFRQVAEGPRKVLRFVPCTRYDADDFFFNPHGYVRLDDPV
jgi:hypothetical protein